MSLDCGVVGISKTAPCDTGKVSDGANISKRRCSIFIVKHLSPVGGIDRLHHEALLD